MPILTPDQAHDVIENKLSYSAGIPMRGGSGHRKKVYLHRLLRLSRREIAIRREPTEAGVTAYINRFSCAGEEFPEDNCGTYFSGVLVTKPYPKGYRGDTGDLGLISSAGQCPTLIPADYPVLRLSCSSLDGFLQLIRWYGGEYSLRARVVSADEQALASVPEIELPATPAHAVAVDAPSVSGDKAELPNGIDAEVGDDGDDGTGRLADPYQRKAVERHAVDLAKAHYGALGFVVQENGKPFDLLCTPGPAAAPGSSVVHVEVKGSISAAVSLHLTKNEIADTRQPGKDWRSDLYVVSRIVLVQDEAGTWSGIGGVPEVHEAWSPDDADLTATDFVYRVPRPKRS